MSHSDEERRSSRRYVEPDFGAAYLALEQAVFMFLHGDPCENDHCESDGYCGQCVGGLEDAHDLVRERYRIGPPPPERPDKADVTLPKPHAPCTAPDCICTPVTGGQP